MMAAGGSADDEAQRHRQRARRAERMAAAWERGAEGERRVAETLSALPHTFAIFHDLRLPAPSKANVDHVVVGPNGIVAIDTKNYSHPVTVGKGKGSDTLWTGRYPMRKELGACAWEAAVVSDLIGYPVDPMMCLIAPSEPARAFDFAGIRVCTPSSLVDEVKARRLGPVDVALATAAIERMFGASPEVRRALPPPAAPNPPVGAATAPGAPARQPTLRALARLADSRLVRFAAAGAALLVFVSVLPAVVGMISQASGNAASDVAERVLERAQVTTTTAEESTQATSPPTTATTTAPPTTVPEIGSPPAVDVVLTCPSPGAAWQMSWVWPGDPPDGAAGYMIRTRQGDGPLFTGSGAGWFSPDGTPPPIEVQSGTSFTIVTDYVDGRSQVVGRTEELFVAPLDDC